jgi:uncharacterized protein YjbI with pentapeptide repeats
MADLHSAYLTKANLREADLRYAMIQRVDLAGADLRGADLNGAALTGARLYSANLSGAHLQQASLNLADLSEADLHSANLSAANLSAANLTKANFTRANLSEASCVLTAFNAVDLSEVIGLDSIKHTGPSTVGVDTLFLSKGRIPDAFLRGCGLSPWEVLSQKMYDPALTPTSLADLQVQVFDAWTKGRSLLNGCFMSYSWNDAQFVDNLRERLVAEGINIWLDRHDMVAGTIQDQVWRAIQIYHAVIIVLSQHSIASDWVENELDMARKKEREQGRAVLCPVALDDSWKQKVAIDGGPGDPSRQLWRTLAQKLVVDFSNWETDQFDRSFEKLLRGLKMNYGPQSAPEQHE